MAKVAVLGCGFGTSIAIMLEKYGHKVTLWSAFSEEISIMKRDGEHKKLLPGCKISSEIELTDDISCVKDKDFVIFKFHIFVREVTINLKSIYKKLSL